MRKIVSTLLIIIFAILAIEPSLIGRYEKTTMDWNSDRNTTINEVLFSYDVGKRKIEKDGKLCIEYYAQKDGLTVKIVC